MGPLKYTEREDWGQATQDLPAQFDDLALGPYTGYIASDRIYPAPLIPPGAHDLREVGEFVEVLKNGTWHAGRVTLVVEDPDVPVYLVWLAGPQSGSEMVFPTQVRDATPAPDIAEGDIVETRERAGEWLPGIVERVRFENEHLYSYIVRRTGQVGSDRTTSPVEVRCPYDAIRRMMPFAEGRTVPRRNPWIVGGGGGTGTRFRN